MNGDRSGGPVAGVLGGGTRFVALCGSLADHERIEVPTTSPDETLGKIARWLEPRAPRAIGVACFGPIELDPASSSYGRILRTPKPGWADADVLAPFQRLAPCALDNDVGAAARAELEVQPAAAPLVYITVGTGVGVGVATSTGVYHGALHPELGHIPAPRRDPFEGVCSFHGACIEGVASGFAIAARSGRDPSSLSSDDPIFEFVGEALGVLMATAVLAYAPRTLVLGGGVVRSRPTLRDRAARAMRESLGGYGRVPTVRGALHDEPGAIGAMLLAVERFAPE